MANRENNWHGDTSWCEGIVAGFVRLDGFGVGTTIVPDGSAFVYSSQLKWTGRRIAENTDEPHNAHKVADEGRL